MTTHSPQPERRVIAGVPFDLVTEAGVIERVLGALREGRGGWVVTHNLDHLRRLKRDPAFARTCETAALRVADGMPVVWAAKLQGTPLPERVAGSSLTLTLTERAAGEQRSLFLLGGTPGTAELAGEMLAKRFPGIRIAGAFCPPLGFERDEKLVAEMHRQLREAQADLIYVALGSPKQENLIVSLLEVCPRSWLIGVGISLSFVTGEVRRAPRWMQKTGLEWAHRLFMEPRRLARRYLVDGVPFAAWLLTGSLARRFRGPRPL